MDTGVDNILGEENATVLSPTRLLIYDLHNDNLLRTYQFPSDHIKDNSFFASIAVDDDNCDDSYAYSADLGKPGLVRKFIFVINLFELKNNNFFSNRSFILGKSTVLGA